MTKKENLKRFEIISVIFSILLGVLLHFTFKWSNNNNLIGVFSAVNESVWEHLKILFIPLLISTIVGDFYFKKEFKNYIGNKTKGTILAIIFIIISHYTYTGIIGSHIALIDISIFIIAIVLAAIYTYKTTINEKKSNRRITILILILLTTSFITYTFAPPKIGIFKDPITNTYGIKK